jgi:hypothetical protein
MLTRILTVLALTLAVLALTLAVLTALRVFTPLLDTTEESAVHEQTCREMRRYHSMSPEGLERHCSDVK